MRDKKPSGEAWDVWHNKGRFAFLDDTSNEIVETSFDQSLDIGDGSTRFVFLSFRWGGGSDADRRFVAGQYFEHFVRGDENFAAVCCYRKSIAVLSPFDGRFGALILCFEFLSKSFELRHRVAIEHGRSRLLTGSESRSVSVLFGTHQQYDSE